MIFKTDHQTHENSALNSQTRLSLFSPILISSRNVIVVEQSTRLANCTWNIYIYIYMSISCLTCITIDVKKKNYCLNSDTDIMWSKFI